MNDRNDAHRRGRFQVLGSISLIETVYGPLRFPSDGGRPSGITVGYALDAKNEPDPQKLVCLTEWNGVPDLFEALPDNCPDCLRECDICAGTGEKMCEGVGCGGEGTRPGPLVDCPGPGCMVESGTFRGDCRVCRGFGQVAQRVVCEMCQGLKVIRCSRCRGTGKYSTGIIGGQTDFLAGKCKTCNGKQSRVKMVTQPIEDHVNAMLPGPIMVAGPIRSIVVDLTVERLAEYGQAVQVFDSEPDGLGDMLFLLVNFSVTPVWPYLVFGILRERFDATALSRRRDFSDE